MKEAKKSQAVSIEQGEQPHGQISSKPFIEVHGQIIDPYQPAIEKCYVDEPERWKRAIGDALWFQGGLYDNSTVTLDEAGRKYFERELEIAELVNPESSPIRRVLDVGCGWGAPLEYLAYRFPTCPRFDGINVSRRQLEYCARRFATQSLSNRVQLYLCNACNIAELPDKEVPYDLVIMRGYLESFTYDVVETTFSALPTRMSRGATLIISVTLYNVDLAQYR